MLNLTHTLDERYILERLQKGAMSFGELRRYLHVMDVETRPAGTGEVLDHLIAAGLVASLPVGRLQLTDAGRQALIDGGEKCASRK